MTEPRDSVDVVLHSLAVARAALACGPHAAVPIGRTCIACAHVEVLERLADRLPRLYAVEEAEQLNPRLL